MKKGRILTGIVVTGVAVLASLALVGFLSQSSGVQDFLGRWDAPQMVASNASKYAAKSSFLTCAAVRERTRDFVRIHYTFRSFNEELSQRTFNRYFQQLDPGKNFFLASDIEKFRSYEKTLPIAIAKVDCKFISDVHDLYLQRVRDAETYVDQALQKPFDFTQDEYLESDRRKLPWAKDATELKERWRKQFKWMALNLRDSEPDAKTVNQKLKKRYNLLRKSAEEKSPDEVNGLFLEAFSESLDPHSLYMLPQDQDDFNVNFSLHFVGIGASLVNTDGYTVIEAIIPGGAAAKDGRLKKGDKIIAVDPGDGTGSTNVVDMELNKVVQLIRGKKDTVVKLSILRKEGSDVKKLDIHLKRDVVNLDDQAARSDIMTVDGKKIGVINLPSFYVDYQGMKQNPADYRSSSGDVAKELKKLQSSGVDGIVLDLRRNGGGDLPECIRLTGFFIDKGPVVQIQNRKGDVESAQDMQPGALYSGPMAILVSKQSASASEILAGALQNYGRALIVGNSRTYGKATVQNVLEVPGTNGRESDGALKITVSKFFQPSGGSNQARGVLSDVTIPDAFLEPLPIGEERNEYALPHTEIAPDKDFHQLQNLAAIVPGLRQKSTQRVNASKEFAELKPLIEKAKKESDNTVIPLKLESKDKEKGEKGSKATPAPTATPQPGLEEIVSSKVISPKDIQLREAANILVDGIKLMGDKKDWTH